VQFDLSWENSWRTTTGMANWDAAWVFVKFRVGESDPTFTSVSSSGTTVTVSSTAKLRVDMPVVVTSGTGAFAANTVISSITNDSQFVVSKTLTTALSNATIACRRIWEHASLDTTDAKHTAPAGSTIKVPNDGANGVGAFIYRSGTGSGTFSLSDVGLVWKYGSNGIADDDYVSIKVFAIEMVYVPQGSFAAGSGGAETSAFTLTTINTATATTAPSGSGGFSGSEEGGYPTGQTAPDNASWPNGYDAFYCMKYEISQGQYRDFLNTLTYNQQTSRAASVTGAPGTTALGGPHRNGLDVQTSGNAATVTPAVYGCNLNGNSTYNEAADGEWVACNFLSWMDGCAYVDWAGLRPMTELEFEKACRGDQAPVANEYAWGDSTIAATAYTLSNTGAADEGIATNYSITNGNASYTVTDGNIDGPLRVGIFSAHGSNSGRITAGATYYGIMEMSGNLWERAVTIGNADGRGFTGVHGNGRLSANGHANQTSWPGLNSVEVTGASGSGYRGGPWNSPESSKRVSDRASAAFSWESRASDAGFRGVRLVP
jgi:formylglycine-generating enzyme required for sulfatase activity